jgi:hypothetical protein
MVVDFMVPFKCDENGARNTRAAHYNYLVI